MNRPAQVASHLAAVVLGIAIAASATGPSPQKPVDTRSARSAPAKSPMAGSGGTTSHAMKQGRQTREALKTADFQMAWDALPAGNRSRAERLDLQRQLLEKWLVVDLQGALDAVINQAWDENAGDPFAENVFPSALSRAFADRPLEAWKLIQSERYGLATHMLLRQWLDSVSKDNSDLLPSLLPELPKSLQERAISACLAQQQPGADRDAMLARIIAQAGDDHRDWLEEAFKRMPDMGDPAALRESWAALPAGTAREIAMLKWGASLRTQDADRVSAELAAVPPAAKEAAAEAMISQLHVESAGLLAMLSFAMTTGSWESLAKSKMPSIVESLGHADFLDAEKTAGWATRLPPQAGNVEIYRAAVARYIWRDLPRAKKWLGAMEDGSWQKENALAVYSRDAMNYRENHEESQWALDSINDPQVKAEVMKWRQEREQRKKDLSGQTD